MPFGSAQSRGGASCPGVPRPASQQDRVCAVTLLTFEQVGQRMNRMSGSRMEMPAMPVLPEELEQAQDTVQSDKGDALGTRRNRGMGWFFVFFFISGFCSILYEVIWLRLAMAQFGVTSALVSIVLSMFMAGLGLGSWASGRLIRKYGDTLKVPVLRL